MSFFECALLQWPSEKKTVNLVWREKGLWSNSWMQISNPLWKHHLPPFFFFPHQDIHSIRRRQRHKEKEKKKVKSYDLKKCCGCNFLIQEHFSFWSTACFCLAFHIENICEFNVNTHRQETWSDHNVKRAFKEEAWTLNQ